MMLKKRTTEEKVDYLVAEFALLKVSLHALEERLKVVEMVHTLPPTG